MGTGKQVPLQMTLLDFGLAEELTPAVRHHFISFLHTISSGALRLPAVQQKFLPSQDS